MADQVVGRLVVRLHRPDGELAGMLGVYVGGGLRGTVQAMLSRGGAALASKDVIERLPDEVATELGIDPGAVAYEILGELERASEKARRDAGGVAICELVV